MKAKAYLITQQKQESSLSGRERARSLFFLALALTLTLKLIPQDQRLADFCFEDGDDIDDRFCCVLKISQL
jgi:hypothetical protein